MYKGTIVMSAQHEETPKAAAERPRGTSVWRKIGISLGVLIFVFLLGLVPAWLKARGYAGELDTAQRELRLSKMQNALSAAALDARRGEYEPARQAASDFFTSLRDEMDRGEESALSASQREGLRPALARRDEIITLLARSDPASADRLLDLYVAYSKTMKGATPQSGAKSAGS